jgi:hypothetical protein
MIKVASFLICSILIFGCNAPVTEADVETNTAKSVSFAAEADYEMRMKAIDNNPNLLVFNSLKYNNNAGSTADASALLNAKQEEVKITENYNLAEKGDFGKRTFYIDQGKKFASVEVCFFKKTNQFVERITYYNKAGQPVFSKKRAAEFEEELEQLPFEEDKPTDCSIDRAMRLLNKEGEFETTFQGFAENGTMKFLLVGENKTDGYASSLSVQFEDVLIKKLFAQEAEMLGTPLEVGSELMADETGMTFQVLLYAKIKS